ncbi:Potassium voltage-gated channel protein Shab [Phytophthora ramorum]|uniref:Potassium voltage-gated channel protein Shab n=2 Tax=Phytophthora ramorum TaxID=164328 RepID=UPI0030ABF811|nr:Potassium voltage-gated channel protein Shab [Phytophthora ramorum]
MVIATAIFYSEPCYNVDTCTFTDIFNSAYFVMVTVATVGYGHQVPSLKNPGSMMLTMLVMILGQIYFSMPVAIIGNNFQRTYENFQLDKKKKARYLDASLSPFDCQTLHSHAKRLCDIQYHLLNAWSVVHQHISGIARTNTRRSQSLTMTMEILETEADRETKIKEGISRLLEVHTEAVLLLQVFVPHRRRSLDMSFDPQSQGMLSNMYAKAKKAIANAKLFFLFTGCIIAGAMFYEIERGRECFVGQPCWWWQKNVLTSELAAGLPIGKRILIQDNVKAIITDMIHSTWLSYTTLTSVGYGDLVPRTAIGKFFDVFVIIVATIYSAMPLSLVGKQFYTLYEKHMENMVVKQGGSSISWRTKSTITILTQYKNTIKHSSVRKLELFALSEEQLIIVHEFESMRRTIQNLQRTLDAATTSTFNGTQRKSSMSTKTSKASATSRGSGTASQRSPASLDQSIELKSAAIIDTLLQFSQVVERLQEAPRDFEAFEGTEDDLRTTNVYPNGYSPRPPSDDLNPDVTLS